MTFDLRTRHSADLHHYSIASNGSSIPSNWRLSATGDSGVVWSPDSAGTPSFGSNSNEVSYVNAAGASTLSSRADHVHRGVTSVAHASNTYTGPVTLETEGSLYIVRSAANTFRFGSTGTTGGGGGGAPTTAEYVVTAADGSLSAEIVIPGLAGSVDIPPGGGSDDEFDASGLSGWTQFGTPTTADSDTTRKSHAYLKKNAASGANVAGIYKANPSTPFTMTAKLSDLGLYGSFNMGGIFVGVTNPSSGAFKACLFQVNGVAGQYNPGVIAWTNPTTYNGGGTYATDYAGILPIYLRIIATSSTDVTFSYSYGGRFFIPIVSGNNPGFTIGSVGLFVNPDSASNPAEADFDWVRFT